MYFTLLKMFLQWPYVLVLDISSMKRHKLSGMAGMVSKPKKLVKYSHCLI